MNLIQDSTVAYLEELKEVTLSDKDNIQQMNNILLNRIDAKNEEINTLKNTLTTICKKLDNSINKTNPKSTKENGKCFNETYYHYCWSHRRTGNARHTSKNCFRRKAGYQEEAIISNRKGGSEENCS